MEDNDFPLISVILPVYNAEKYLKTAIQSIISQTFTDFEFLIINDGSTDNSVAIINSFKDYRIKLIDKTKNEGLVAALNDGIALAKGKYIARMDADDISYPQRLKLQFDFMENNPDYGACFSQTKIFYNSFSFLTIKTKPPSNTQHIKAEMLLRTPVAHPTAFFRASVLLNNRLFYDKACKAEDYDLFERLSTISKLYCIPCVLLKYRIHFSQISKKENANLQKSAALISQRSLNRYFKLNSNELEILSSLNQSHTGDKNKFIEVKNILLKLRLLNSQNKEIFPTQSFERYLSIAWRVFVGKSRLPIYKKVFFYFKFNDFKYIDLSLMDIIRFLK